MTLKDWTAYGVKRILLLISLLVAVSALAFTLLEASPIDPVKSYIGAETIVSVEQREAIAEHWGLNQPPITRYFKWLGSVSKGDFGTSMIYRQPVIKVIGERFKASLLLMGIAWIASGVIGFTLGIISGVKQNSLADKIIKGYCMLLETLPSFWLGLLLLLIFAVQLKIFPVGLSVPIGVLKDQVTFMDRLKHVALPAITLSLVGIAGVTMYTRTKVIEVMESDYVLFAKARGESGFGLVWRHTVRNAIIPAMTLQFASLSELFGGAVLAEQVFSYPGLGEATVAAGLKADIPLLMGIVVFSAIFIFTGNSIADIMLGIVDPRIRAKEQL